MNISLIHKICKYLLYKIYLSINFLQNQLFYLGYNSILKINQLWLDKSPQSQNVAFFDVFCRILEYKDESFHSVTNWYILFSSNFIKVTPLNPDAFSLLFFGMHGVFFYPFLWTKFIFMYPMNLCCFAETEFVVLLKLK